MADLQIFLDELKDTYGMYCNYKVYKENNIISCNSNSEVRVLQSVQATTCRSEAGIPE